MPERSESGSKLSRPTNGREIEDVVERILFRRSLEGKLEGYTQATALEISEAITTLRPEAVETRPEPFIERIEEMGNVCEKLRKGTGEGIKLMLRGAYDEGKAFRDKSESQSRQFAAQLESNIKFLNERVAGLREAEHILRNLLAVVHRDGGHHASEHGLEASGEQAEAIVLGLREEIERLKGKLELLNSFYASDANEVEDTIASAATKRMIEAQQELTELRSKLAEQEEALRVMTEIAGHRWDGWEKAETRAEAAEAEVAALREAEREWRQALLNAWANDHRSVMTALLEMGPSKALSAAPEPEAKS